MYCNHGNSVTSHCSKCHAEQEKRSKYAVKIGRGNQLLSECPVVKVFKTKKGAENFCKKYTNPELDTYYTYVLVDKE